MLVAISDSLSDLACLENGEDGEDVDDEQTAQVKLCEYGEPSWVMGTIIKTIQQRMERFCHTQIMRKELTQPGREDAAN